VETKNIKKLQGVCTTELHKEHTTEVYTIKPVFQNRSILEAETNKKSLKQWEDKETIPK
jgi:hypothetical protein